MSINNSQKHNDDKLNNNQEIPKSFDDIREAIIDGQGQFKFAQIEIINSETDETKMVIRGYEGLTHPEILKKFIFEELKDIPVKVKSRWQIKGKAGGIIIHKARKIQIYGTSEEFGRPNHSLVKDIIGKEYKGYRFAWTSSEQENMAHQSKKVGEN